MWFGKKISSQVAFWIEMHVLTLLATFLSEVFNLIFSNKISISGAFQENFEKKKILNRIV